MTTSYLTNGGFHHFDVKANSFEGWTLQRPGNRTFVDTETTHGGSGASLRIGSGFGPALAMQALSTTPKRRQLRVSYWAKSSGFATVQYNVELCKIDRSQRGENFNIGRRISWTSMVINATQDWTQYEFVSSSWDGGLGLFIGLQPDAWNADGSPNRTAQPMNGTLWFDDIEVTDTALVNTVRRRGAPLRVYEPPAAGGGGGKQFQEGVDFDPIAPAANFTGFVKGLRNTANVTLPQGSELRKHPGMRVLIDYYAVALVFNGGTYGATTDC
eukprot:SAG25_NODE_245_length_11100_cov_4.621671_3_plen_271_part_00